MNREIPQYQIRVLSEHTNLVVNSALSSGALCVNDIIKKCKNTSIIEIGINDTHFPILYFLLKDKNIPFTLKGIKGNYSEIYYTINQDYEFTSKRKPTPNWFEQEERYKFYKMLKITG